MQCKIIALGQGCGAGEGAGAEPTRGGGPADRLLSFSRQSEVQEQRAGLLVLLASHISISLDDKFPTVSFTP